MSGARNNRQPVAIIAPSPHIPSRPNRCAPCLHTPSRPRASRPVETTGLALPLLFSLVLLAALASVASAQQHRAEQTREITYWMLDPATHQFRISHDFTVDTPGQRYVHSFVRAGSEVTDAEVWDVDAGMRLTTTNVTGRDVNALSFYRNRYDDDMAVVQAELLESVGAGETTRVRVIETYTDAERYYMDGDELVWDRSLGRPYNIVKLPPGWMLTAVNIPAVISTDGDGLVSLRFINIRSDSIGVVIRARRRP